MWAEALNALGGIWLIIAPAALGYGGAARTVDRVVGPLVAGCAIVALWPAMRALGRLNVIFGLALLIAPWPLGFPAVAAANTALVGAAVVALALASPPARERVGGGWLALRRYTTDGRRREAGAGSGAGE